MRILSTLFLILAFSLVYSQGESSLLWRISGKNLKQPSYLFGTIHISDQRIFSQLGTTFDSVFNSCDAYAMEVIIDQIDQKELQKSMYMSKGKISDYLNDVQEHRLDSMLRSKVGLGLVFFDKMKPVFFSSILEGSTDTLGSGEALDLYLLSKARTAQKLTFGIEKAEEQFSALDEMKIEEQMEFLIQFLDDTSSESNSMNEFEELLGAYLNSDLDKLFVLVNDTSFSPKMYKKLIVDRNAVMAKRIPKLCKKQSTFNAVGAGHLPGKDGVINLLRKKGYTVEAVKY